MKHSKKQPIIIPQKHPGILPIPQELIIKEIFFRFHGENLRFYLSQSLFSSFDIDRGTKFLLKTIARKMDISSYETCADIGCGAGVLGLSIKKKYPHISLTGIDRDALAVTFSQLNAKLNGLTTGVYYKGGLGLEGLDNPAFDLIVSNLPAKAGNPVLRTMIEDFCRSLSTRGCAAVVIIQALKGVVERALLDCHAAIVYAEETKDYKVFHFTYGNGGRTSTSQKQTFPLLPYIRSQEEFEYGGTVYTIQTVYNIADFDTLSYGTRLAMELLHKEKMEGTILFWRPGQGHMPLFLRKASHISIARYILAGRDYLELSTSRYNLLKDNMPADSLEIFHLPTFHPLETCIKEPVYCIIFFLDPDNSSIPGNEFSNTMDTIIHPGGLLLIVGKSTPVYRLTKHLHHFSVLRDKKYHGFRGLLLKPKKKN